MLSSVLNSSRAVQVNIAIMRTFVQLRRLMDCIDPAETAQVRLLMRKPQQVFSSPAPGVGAGGCKSQSSHQ